MNKAFIIDLEGTLVSSGEPLDGSKEFIHYLNKNNVPYYIITNTVSKTVEQMEENLTKNGVDVLKGHIINPIIVLNDFIKENDVKTYHFVGPDYLKKLVEKSSDYEKYPEYIVFCDFEYIDINYDYMNKLFQYIKNGSKMITTSYSNYYISKNEYKMDTGIFVKMYEIMMNEKAVIMGKPSKMIYKMALEKLKINSKDVITIGDDGLTDIEGGKEIGMETILVKTGKYKEGDEKIYKANRAIRNLRELI